MVMSSDSRSSFLILLGRISSLSCFGRRHLPSPSDERSRSTASGLEGPFCWVLIWNLPTFCLVPTSGSVPNSAEDIAPASDPAAPAAWLRLGNLTAPDAVGATVRL